MASFNQGTFIGNLTRDPQIKHLPSGTQVAEFGFAVNRKFKDGSGQDREEVMFMDAQAFGRAGEIIHQYCHRGDLIFLQGRIIYQTWDDKQGQKRSKHSLTVENFQLVHQRERGSNSAPPSNEDPPF